MDEFNNEMDMPEVVFNVKSSEPFSGETLKTKKTMDISSAVNMQARIKKISDEKRAELMKKYSVVVVHDYSDEYHMSEEEKKAKSVYYEVFAKLRRCKRKYRKLDEFVRAYRISCEVLRVVAERNGVYDPEKFVKKVLDGDIHVNGLSFPKYTGKDKKDINWDYVSDYILDFEKNPDDLKNVDTDDDPYEDCDLYTDTEFDNLMESVENAANVECIDYDGIDVHPEQFLTVRDKKSSKNFIRDNPQVLKAIKKMEITKRKENARRRQLASMGGFGSTMSFDFNFDDFAKIEEMDESRGYHSSTDMPEFHGDILDKKAYRRYMHELDVYENEVLKRPYNGKNMSETDIMEIEARDAFDAAGWNTRRMFNNAKDRKKMKKIAKADKKREKDLKKKILNAGKKHAEVSLNVKSKKKKKKSKESD